MTAPRANGVLDVSLLGIGLQGPGFADWATGRAALHDPALWHSAPTVLVPPARLPPAERRRAGAIVKLCIAVADQACAQAGADTLQLATVFTASAGDGANCSALCEVLATPERMVSPTRFTNSVHNAAAGYWHIATTSRAPSTSLCAHDASFGAGLLEAASQCVAWQRPVLLVAGDTPYPEPLNGARPLPDAFACALLLAPAGQGGNALAQLRLQLDAGTPTACEGASLEALRQAIPAARGLSLLQALAQGAAQCTVEYQDGLALRVDLTPSTPA
ncbi:beta-ketoacyl synthase chain length factor [Ideonella sp. BN130291]|uniref:beta-ketoacyl synthase chain length factor n=1 Tax=Ideonella sp. BN130291 TaxID=3112940 RepID=UPI002E25B7CC|nr:beta-ketoacyl synthase chain length factor [Ideonella sp. BN130291]